MRRPQYARCGPELHVSPIDGRRDAASLGDRHTKKRDPAKSYSRVAGGAAIVVVDCMALDPEFARPSCLPHSTRRVFSCAGAGLGDGV